MAKANPDYDAKTIRFVTSLCQRLSLELRQDGADRVAIEQKFIADCCRKFSQEAGMSLAFTMLNMMKDNPGYIINNFNNEGDVIMPNAKKAGRDTVDASMNAGRDIISSAGGMKNKATIRDNKTTTQTIDQSHSVNPKLVKALESGRKAIDKLKMSEAMKEQLKKEYEELAVEVSKPKPEKSTIKKLWENISHFASKAAPLVGLGKLIAGMFGLNLAGVEITPEV